MFWYRLARTFEGWHYAPTHIVVIILVSSSFLFLIPSFVDLFVHNTDNEYVATRMYFLLLSAALYPNRAKKQRRRKIEFLLRYMQWPLWFAYRKNPQKFIADWYAGFLEIFFAVVLLLFDCFANKYNLIVLGILACIIPIMRQKLWNKYVIGTQILITGDRLLTNSMIKLQFDDSKSTVNVNDYAYFIGFSFFHCI